MVLGALSSSQLQLVSHRAYSTGPVETTFLRSWRVTRGRIQSPTNKGHMARPESSLLTPYFCACCLLHLKCLPLSDSNLKHPRGSAPPPLLAVPPGLTQALPPLPRCLHRRHYISSEPSVRQCLLCHLSSWSRCLQWVELTQMSLQTSSTQFFTLLVQTLGPDLCGAFRPHL